MFYRRLDWNSLEIMRSNEVSELSNPGTRGVFVLESNFRDLKNIWPNTCEHLCTHSKFFYHLILEYFLPFSIHNFLFFCLC